MKDAKPQAAGEGAAASGSSSSSSSSSEKEAPAKKPKFPPYAEVFRDADDPIPGLIKLRRKGGTLYAEISSSQLNRDFIVVMSIARGIGRGSLLAGMSWNFGDDSVWQFRKVDDYIHVVRRNVRFKADAGSPEEKAVNLAFTDSILFSLPIVTMSPVGRLRGRFESDLHDRFAANFARAAGLFAFPRSAPLGRRPRASKTTSNWKWPRPTLPADRRKTTTFPTRAARRSMCITRSAICRKTAITRAWPTIASAIS